MKALFILLLSILLLFAECKHLKYGNIVDKYYEPAHSYIYLMPITHNAGKFSYTTFMSVPMYDNEDWCIKVRGVSTKGDTITRTLYVSKESYDTLRIGNFLCIDGMCDEDNNNTKQ